MKKLIVGITVPGSVGLLKGQLKYFKEKGYDTCLMTQQDDRSRAYCENEGCKMLDVRIARNISLSKDIKTLSALIRMFRKERPDIVNVGTPKMGLLGMIAAWWCRVPNRIYTCRGFRYEHERGKLRKVLKMCERISGACANTIICISPSVKALGVRDKLFKEKKCVVINKGSSNGIDPRQFSASDVSKEDTLALKEKYGIAGKFVYGFLGRIIDRKGINELYRAFCRVYEKDENTRLFVVGPWDDEQISDKSLYKKMKEHPGIVLPGRTDNAPLYLSAMDIFVLPAWWEGFGNVVVQAADMGIAVIGSTGTGVCDAVSDGFNGASNGPVWGQNFIPETIWEGMDRLYNAR